VRDGSGCVEAARSALARWCAIAVAAGAPLLAGCTAQSPGGGYGATVAFESIDGPPLPVFDRLVAHLDFEAQARQVAVVSRQMPARYRVRAYLIPRVAGRRTTIGWVWDVYDADLNRAMRIAGEEPAGRSGGDAWALADDRVLGRIAEAGMIRLAAFASGSDVEPAAATARPPDASPAEPTDPPAADGDIRVAAATVAVPAPGFRPR